MSLLMIAILTLGLLVTCASSETVGSESGKDGIVIGTAMPVFEDKCLS
jgi:hypothetical protein